MVVDDDAMARATTALQQADADLRRDWHGHELSDAELRRFAAYVLNHAELPMGELVDQVAVGMLAFDIPMIAEEPPSPHRSTELAEDDHIETLVRIVLEAAGVEGARL